jgi:hypothetical protein
MPRKIEIKKPRPHLTAGDSIFPEDVQGVTLTRKKPFVGVPFDPLRLNVRYS